MAVCAADIERYLPIQEIGRQLRCDWIKMIDPIHRFAQSRATPDMRDNYTVKIGNLFFWHEETRTKDFWCHEVEWSIGGQRFSAAIPMKLKSEWRGCGFFAHMVPAENGEAMFVELIAMIKKSKTLPMADGPVCWL